MVLTINQFKHLLVCLSLNWQTRAFCLMWDVLVYPIIYWSPYKRFHLATARLSETKTVTVQQRSKQEQPAHTLCTDRNTLCSLPCADTHLHHLVPVLAQQQQQQQRRLSLSPWPGSIQSQLRPQLTGRCWHEFGEAVRESHREVSREGDQNEEERELYLCFVFVC